MWDILANTFQPLPISNHKFCCDADLYRGGELARVGSMPLS